MPKRKNMTMRDLVESVTAIERRLVTAEERTAIWVKSATEMHEEVKRARADIGGIVDELLGRKEG
jgi:hypothetical protein